MSHFIQPVITRHSLYKVVRGAEYKATPRQDDRQPLPRTNQLSVEENIAST